MWYYIKIIIVSLFSIYILIFLVIYLMQEKLIFVPDSLPTDYIFYFPGNYEELNFEAPDGANLNALYFTVEDPIGVILYFHGNAGSLLSWGEVAQNFVELQYNVLIMDFRGYGKSIGNLNETSLYEDTQIFYDYLLERYSQNDIIVYGRSLGTTFATYVAAQNNPQQLILESPFYNIRSVAKAMFPIYPTSWFLKYKFPTHKYITKVNCPITIFHGTEDSMIKIKNSEDLVNIVSDKIINLIKIEGANHNDLEDFESYSYNLKELLVKKVEIQ